MVKPCFYASELVQGCSKVRFSPFSMAKHSGGDLALLAHFWSEDCHIWHRTSLSIGGLDFWLARVLEEVAFSTSEWSKSRSLVLRLFQHLTNDLDFDHSEVENVTSSNTQGTYFLRSTYGWRGPVPNITVLSSKMAEINSFRDGGPVIISRKAKGVVHEKSVKSQRLQILLQIKMQVPQWIESLSSKDDRPHFKNERAKLVLLQQPYHYMEKI